jgi:hypothetical protein
LGKFDDGWNVRQLGAAPGADRIEEAHLIVLDPILPRQNVAEARTADALTSPRSIASNCGISERSGRT